LLRRKSGTPAARHPYHFFSIGAAAPGALEGIKEFRSGAIFSGNKKPVRIEGWPGVAHFCVAEPGTGFEGGLRGLVLGGRKIFNFPLRRWRCRVACALGANSTRRVMGVAAPLEKSWDAAPSASEMTPTNATKKQIYKLKSIVYRYFIVPIKHPWSLPSASPLLSHGQLKDALAAYANPRMKISRMLAAGELIPLRRGLYLRDRTVDPQALASAIHGPSYVSFESALAWHGLIPERVEEITSATPKQPVRFETPVGRYRYRHVPARVFSIGIERVEDSVLPWLVASPAKALCDTVALDASIRSQKDVRAWLEGMRIEDLPALDPDQLDACAANYGRPSVRHLARFFQKNPPTP
jgi:hypothetical protein